jgi:hypothetical protein
MDSWSASEFLDSLTSVGVTGRRPIHPPPHAPKLLGRSPLHNVSSSRDGSTCDERVARDPIGAALESHKYFLAQRVHLACRTDAILFIRAIFSDDRYSCQKVKADSYYDRPATVLESMVRRGVLEPPRDLLPLAPRASHKQSKKTRPSVIFCVSWILSAFPDSDGRQISKKA